MLDPRKAAEHHRAEGAAAERKRIVEWIRVTPRAGGVIVRIEASNDIARLADAIEAGEHERGGT